MTPDTDGKSLVDLLDMLKPAPEPTPISMTPQTFGWVVLGGLLAAVIMALVFLIHRHRKANAYRKLALSELDGCGNDAAQVSEILRRTALMAYPRSEVAGIFGTQWITFLKQTADISEFSESTLANLISAPYQKEIKDPAAADLARHWIRTHKAERTT